MAPFDHILIIDKDGKPSVTPLRVKKNNQLLIISPYLAVKITFTDHEGVPIEKKTLMLGAGGVDMFKIGDPKHPKCPYTIELVLIRKSKAGKSPRKKQNEAEMIVE